MNQRPTIEKGKRYVLPGGAILEVLQVSECYGQVRMLTSGKLLEISSRSDLREATEQDLTAADAVKARRLKRAAEQRAAERDAGKTNAGKTNARRIKMSEKLFGNSAVAILRYIGTNIAKDTDTIKASVIALGALGATVAPSTAGIQIRAGVKRGAVPTLNAAQQKQLNSELAKARKALPAEQPKKAAPKKAPAKKAAKKAVKTTTRKVAKKATKKSAATSNKATS